MSTASVQQPKWIKPVQEKGKPALKLYNSLTRSKEEFIPLNANEITWYSCGPTVYDSSHMGHARNYVTIDINRRILQDYFGYNILFIQNVTDIDDKIIIKSRQEHLFKEFCDKNELKVSESVLKEVKESWELYVAKNLPAFGQSGAVDFVEWSKNFDVSADPKFPMYLKLALRGHKLLQTVVDSAAAAPEFFNDVKDVVVPSLDAKYGSLLTDLDIFRKTSSYWEQQYDQDMEKLNVLPADVVTRVSEFIPEIISFVKGIIDKGYAYATKDGSVYFNSAKFDHSELHDYAKLLPWSKSDMSLLLEGEGSLTVSEGKLSNSDFALWKSSKPGEPFFESPWGSGRPGWHIECSVMASSISPERLDIHSGGIDLLFPHHDNEIAQSEAYYDSPQWVNYFLHTGHLHIEGQKMSKSLKNFITIDEALAKYTARQLRLCFALVQWNNQLDFKESLINEVRALESTFNKFFATVRALNNDYKHDLAQGKIISKYLQDPERQLLLELSKYKVLVDELFRDNLSTPVALRSLVELVSKANLYIQSVGDEIRIQSVLNVATFITRILSIVGFDVRKDKLGWEDSSSVGSASSVEDVLLPYVKVLSTFRDTARKIAIEKQDYKVLLQATDDLRDRDLLNLGVLLDDRSSTGALIKFLNEQERKELLEQQAESAKQAELKKLKLKLNLLKEALKLEEKLKKAKVSPQEMFKLGEHLEKFSEWDEQGLPTKDKEGVELTKSARKKLTKLWDQQKKLHEEYLKTVDGGK